MPSESKPEKRNGRFLLLRRGHTEQRPAESLRSERVPLACMPAHSFSELYHSRAAGPQDHERAISLAESAAHSHPHPEVWDIDSDEF